MNKRQKKKKTEATDVENLTSRIYAHISETNRLLNQQRVLLEVQKTTLNQYSIWQNWALSLPIKDGYYIVYSKGGAFGLIYCQRGIYLDQQKKAIDAKKLANVVAWLPLPSVPEHLTGGNK